MRMLSHLLYLEGVEVNLNTYFCMQAMLEHVEGISLVGLASPVNAEALSRMPNLRILIADGMDVRLPLTGSELAKLAMLSWREKAGRELSFDWTTIRKASVIDLQGCPTLTDLPDGLQVCKSRAHNQPAF